MLNKLSRWIVVAGAYFITGKLGLLLAYGNSSATVFWPPSGIALAAILLLGYEIVPAICIAAFLVNVTTTGNIFTSAGIAFGNTLEVLVASYLINRFARSTSVFDKIENLYKFLLVCIAGSIVAAIIGPSTLYVAGLVKHGEFTSVFLTWWVGDFVSLLKFTPFVFLLAQRPSSNWNKKKVFELIVCLIGLILSCLIIFAGRVFELRTVPIGFLAYPFLIWISYRFTQKEAMCGTLVLTVVSIFGTLNGFGPFAGYSPNTSLFLLELYIAVSVLMSLFLSTAVYEREKLNEFHEDIENRFKSLIEKSSDAITLIDSHANILYSSPSTHEILGYTPEEFEKINGLDIVHPDDQEVAKAKLMDLLSAPRKTNELEYRIMHKNGTYKWVHAIGTNLLDNPSVRAIVINFRDITSRKHLEQYVQNERNQFRDVITSLTEGLIMVDANLDILIFNRAAEDLLKVSATDATGQKFDRVIDLYQDKVEITKENNPVSRALKTGITTSYAMHDNIYLKVGEKMIPITLSVNRIGGYNFRKALIIFRDITQDKAIDQMKTEFISVAAHQLRGPLGIMRWNLELLNKELSNQSITESFKDKFQKIYTGCLRMISLVNDFLSVSRIDQGRVTAQPELINVNDVINAVLTESASLTKKKGLEVSAKIAPEVQNVFIDKKQFHEVIFNLVSNAIKYSNDKGKIEVTGELSAPNQVRICVLDQGIGLPDSAKSKLFTKFFRAENAMLKDPEGSGLGLYVVEFFVKQWGGKIWYDSVEGQGAKFYVSFPLKQASSEEV